MAKVTKSQIIEGLKNLGDRVQLNVETQSVVDYTLDAYEENDRNVTMDDLKEVLATVKESTGLSDSEIILGKSATAPKTEGKAKLPNKKEAENSVKGETIKPEIGRASCRERV